MILMWKDLVGDYDYRIIRMMAIYQIEALLLPATFKQRLTDRSPTHGSYHWIAERALSVGLIPLTLVPFAAGSLNPAMDAVLITTLVLHTHIGFQYVYPILFEEKEQSHEISAGTDDSFTEPSL